MSKSLGNVVDPFNVSKQLTNEGLRYFLLKQGVQSDDSSKFIFFFFKHKIFIISKKKFFF